MKSGVLFIAIVLIAIGVVSLAYQGITYRTREKGLEVGHIKTTKDREHTLPLPPILGVLALARGVVLLMAAARRQPVPRESPDLEPVAPSAHSVRPAAR